ncbi:RIP metalloprotease RseP [Oleiharenicola lentus]|uniref:Zinc metalloprotease n=1 Tax=Oleiharenicola lentus TaxID=2508720 RepID=A0A4Q1C9I2_9BACT|nr:RIP metalloprotease RseP [Oleiharenicola lentus]RXK55644.1 RIP metalloprotease RseP [Oleiharenicola lentus]
MLQLLLAIGLVTLSIFIHELGHFLAARWRGMVVPRFSIFGIGKPIVSWKWRGVEYCICWLPIGAYVMVPQLSDLGDFEGDVPEAAKNLPPASYLSKVIVAVAGPAANILFALALGCIVWAVGVNVPAEFNRTEIGEVAKEVVTTDGKTVPGPAFAAGLQPGDIIRSVDGKPVANFQDLITAIILGSQIAPDGRRVMEITLERAGATLTKQVYPELTGTEGLRTVGLAPRSDLVIDKVNADSPAALAGLRAGDRIIAVDGKPLARRDELREHFQKKSNEPSTLLIQRDGKELTASLQPRLQTIEGQTLFLIGVTWRIETVLMHPTPFAQIGDALTQVYQTLSSLLNRQSDIGVRHMSGIVGIVDNLQQVATIGIIPALAFLIAINVSLAIFNLLPIPVLDGGHVVFATLAKLRGKPLNPVWMQNAVAACFVLLIGLIVYVSYNDIRRAIQGRSEAPPAKSAPAKPVEPVPAGK